MLAITHSHSNWFWFFSNFFPRLQSKIHLTIKVVHFYTRHTMLVLIYVRDPIRIAVSCLKHTSTHGLDTRKVSRQFDWCRRPRIYCSQAVWIVALNCGKCTMNVDAFAHTSVIVKQSKMWHSTTLAHNSYRPPMTDTSNSGTQKLAISCTALHRRKFHFAWNSIPIEASSIFSLPAPPTRKSFA